VAHVAGAIFGLLYAWRGWNLGGLADLTARFRRRQMRVVRPEDGPGRQVKDERPQSKLDEELKQAVDTILEKISRSGESSLTSEERDTLTRASRRLKERV
jgi:hypothetical protein